MPRAGLQLPRPSHLAARGARCATLSGSGEAESKIDALDWLSSLKDLVRGLMPFRFWLEHLGCGIDFRFGLLDTLGSFLS